MSEQTDNIIARLTPFGLTEEESRIYLELLEKRVATALELSRKLHIGRTKVYRILDKLIEKELVIQKLDSGGFKFAANTTEQLGTLLQKREAELIALRNSLPETKKLLEEKTGTDVPGTKVLYYRGKEGLSQVNWNLLNTKGELLSYEIATADVYMPQEEAEKLRQGIAEKKFTVRTITNKTEFKPFTKVTKMVENYWEIKSIPETVLAVKADIFIYNDVYAVCHYLSQGDVFCIEIYNRELAAMQRQIFEVMWQQARGMKKIGNEGAAVLL